MKKYSSRSASRRLLFCTALTLLLVLAACTQGEAETSPTQITQEFPSEPPATFTPPPPTPDVQVPSVTPEPTLNIPNTGEGLADVGEDIFREACAACHQSQGQGAAGIYPPLNGSGFVNSEDPNPLVSVIITGRGGMPTFHNMLSPGEVAAVVTYIRGAWENDSDPVTVEQVRQVWQETGLPLEEDEEEE